MTINKYYKIRVKRILLFKFLLVLLELNHFSNLLVAIILQVKICD